MKEAEVKKVLTEASNLLADLHDFIDGIQMLTDEEQARFTDSDDGYQQRIENVIEQIQQLEK